MRFITKKEKKFSFIEAGEGHPLILLHGLMGGLSNFDKTFENRSALKLIAACAGAVWARARFLINSCNRSGLPFSVDRVSRRRHSTYFEIPEQLHKL